MPTKRSPPEVPAGLTVYVDATLGDDATARIQDEAKPFKTFRAALRAIRGSHRMGPWIVQARPGTYRESVALPSGVSLNGSNQQTTIAGTLTVDGPSVITDITVDATKIGNVPVLVVRSGVVDMFTSTLLSSFTDRRADNAASVIHAGAAFTKTSVTLLAGSTGARRRGSTSCWEVRGSLISDQCINRFEVTGGAGEANLYRVLGAGASLAVRRSSSVFTLDVPAGGAVGLTATCFNDSGNASFSAHRTEIDTPRPLHAPARVAVVHAVGPSTTAVIQGSVVTDSALSPRLLRAAIGVADDAGKKPVVGVLGLQYLTDSGAPTDWLSGPGFVPPFEGAFGLRRHVEWSQAGSTVSSGGLSLGVRTVSGSYTIAEDDSTVLVRSRPASSRSTSSPGDRRSRSPSRATDRAATKAAETERATIILPDPRAEARVTAAASGRIVVVKNVGRGLAVVRQRNRERSRNRKGKGKNDEQERERDPEGAVPGSERAILRPGDSAIFQSDGERWFVIADHRASRHRHPRG